MELMEICLNTTYFVYRDTTEPWNGNRLTSVTNRSQSIRGGFQSGGDTNTPHPPPHPLVWFRYVDTFTMLHSYHVEEFMNHINSREPHIKFTVEKPKEGSLTFLDTKITVKRRWFHQNLGLPEDKNGQS